MSVVMNFAMFPTGQNHGISEYVAKVVKSVKESGFESQLTAMGTLVETETLSQALRVIENAYATLEDDCERVYVTVNLDIRKGGLGRIKSKTQSVEQKL